MLEHPRTAHLHLVREEDFGLAIYSCSAGELQFSAVHGHRPDGIGHAPARRPQGRINVLLVQQGSCAAGKGALGEIELQCQSIPNEVIRHIGCGLHQADHSDVVAQRRRLLQAQPSS